jgi:peptide deformylase
MSQHSESRVRWLELSRLSLRVFPDAVLREMCAPIELFDSTLRDLLAEMLVLMRARSGIGLAAPQVGLRQRLFVAEIESRPLCVINPTLQPLPGEATLCEGCLSLPGVEVNVTRPASIVATGYDEHGHKRQWPAAGLWARVIQHETDHLNGVLIIDHGPSLPQHHDENDYIGNRLPRFDL